MPHRNILNHFFFFLASWLWRAVSWEFRENSSFSLSCSFSWRDILMSSVAWRSDEKKKRQRKNGLSMPSRDQNIHISYWTSCIIWQRGVGLANTRRLDKMGQTYIWNPACRVLQKSSPGPEKSCELCIWMRRETSSEKTFPAAFDLIFPEMLWQHYIFIQSCR